MKWNRTIGQPLHELFDSGRLILIHLFRRSVRNESAFADQKNQISKRASLIDVVSNDNAGDAENVVGLPNQPHDCANSDGIQTSEGFVIHDELRVHHECSRQSDTADHSTG